MGDIRFAFRALRRNPGFTIVALLTLALGIGLNTAVFSVVHSVVIRPMPYSDPGALYTIWEDQQRIGGPLTEWTGRSTFFDWRERSGTFTDMTVVNGWAPNLTDQDRPQVLQGALVSPGYFRLLGAEPRRGRGFLPEEELPGNDAVVVVGHDLWLDRFGGSDDIVGRTLVLNGEPRTVVGVAPPGFRAPLTPNAQIWGIQSIDPSMNDRGNHFLQVIGRLNPGTSIEAAQNDMMRVATTIAEEHPNQYADVGVTLQPLHETVVGTVRAPLFVLLGAVALVLLIACANVANLLLARASVRERELAVRASLGAGKGRIVRQLLTESMVLGLGGGLLGLGLGVWGTELLVQIAPAATPRLAEIGMDATVFLYALGASVATGLVFGLAPALGLANRSASNTLREGSRGSSSASGGRLRAGIVVTEIALGVAVLFAAGLLLRSFREMQTIDPGFAVDQTLSARLQLTPGSYPDAASIRLMADQLEERLAARPGVRAVGIGSVVPLSGLVEDVSFGVEGALPEPGRAPLADHWRATPGFFESLRIPLISGRYLQATDREGSVPVVVVSRSLAERHFPGVDPIGRRIKVGGVNDPEAPWWTVVGVVETLRTRGIAQAPEAEVFQAFDQRPARGLSVIVHTEADPIGFVDELRETIWSLDPNMPISQVTTLDSMFTASMAPERFVSLLLGVFAALALALGVVGIYGVMAYIVERQTREIGIRLALGAQPQRLLGSVLRRGFLLTGLGVALGLAGALSAGRALSNLLFRVSPSDPVTLATVVGLLALAALVACYWPARKATRVDPIITLRAE